MSLKYGEEEIYYSRVALQRTPRGGGEKKLRCIRTENFPSREIGTWEKKRHNGGYVVNGVRCNATPLYFELRGLWDAEPPPDAKNSKTSLHFSLVNFSSSNIRIGAALTSNVTDPRL